MDRMGEPPSELKITHPRTGTKKTLAVTSSAPIDADANETIHRITATLPGTKEKKVSLIVKHVGVLAVSAQEKGMSNADIWIRKWQLLKDAGIPVVPTVRKVSDTEVAMTDLAADGSGVYGKHDLTENRNPRETDHFLPQISYQEIESKAQEIASKADKARILLANDDAFALVIHPDGQWEIMALDIGLTELVKDFTSKIHPNWLEYSNQSVAGELSKYIIELRERLNIL